MAGCGDEDSDTGVGIGGNDVVRFRILEYTLVCSGLDSDGLGSGPGLEATRPHLQTPLSPVELHIREQTKYWGLRTNIQALALANECTAVGGEIDNVLLADLVDGLGNNLDVLHVFVLVTWNWPARRRRVEMLLGEKKVNTGKHSCEFNTPRVWLEVRIERI